jgi:uncharacterized LabA/DUF88 family protein
MPESFITHPQPIDPHLRRWMSFFDGENLTIRAQEIASTGGTGGVDLVEGPYFMRDTFVWVPTLMATRALDSTNEMTLPLQRHAVRAYYYTSVKGDEEKIRRVEKDLFEIGFAPKVFKRSKTRGSKAVDITLATDMLSHAYRDNYDVAFLVAGDGDYVPLVEEVKRLGKVVYVSFFKGSGLNEDLELASDTFFYLDDFFWGQWKQHLSSL